MPAYKDSKTGTWFVKFYCKDWTGENKQIKKRGYATKREALDYSEYIERIKQIGSFTFEYIFMKLQNQKKEVFFYKEIGKTRNEWLEEHGGIKIYRDNFWVRPYGENGSDSFDWLGLEARNNANPVAVSSKTEAWTVRNAQGQGTVFIS